MLAHELGHYLFDAGHTTISGLMTNNGASGTFALCGWERERLGYSAYTTASQDNFTVTLQDYVTTGQILKIPVPNSTNKYFLVENHQRLSKFDQIMRGGALQGAFDTTTTLGKGVYVWLIKSGDYYPPTVDIKTANGNWNWVYDGAYYAGPGWGETGYLPKTKKSSVNRDGTGKSDRYPLHIYINNPVFGTPRTWEKWVELNDFTNQYELTRNVMGLETHPFNYNYTQLLTPWSSPSSYVDAVTNLAMQIYSQNGNNVTVKTFNTYNSCLSLPPSKPQYLQVTASSTNHPQLTWAANIEPDKSYYKIYKYSYSELGWQFLGIATTPYYQDISESYCTPGQQCLGHNVMYKVTCIDTQSKESVPSDPITAYVRGANQEKIVVNPPIQNLPSEYSLSTNYPNPFNPTTIINYAVKEAGLISIKVYDILGEEVATLVNQTKEAGEYAIQFNASTLPSGVYIYTMQVNGFSSSRKMLLMK